MKTEKKSKKYLVFIILTVTAVVMLVPFAWMVLTAFKTKTESTSMNPFVVFPSQWRLDAFKTVFSQLDFVKLYVNTILMIVGRVGCAIVTSAMAGYAFGRMNFRGKKLAFSLVLFQMMVPPQIFILPQYLMINKLGMQNTVFALIFPGLVSAFGTFLLRQSFKGLPKELEEASRLDGCNAFQTFLHVMLPLVKSNIVALGIFTALFAYKDLMWPLIVNTEQSSMPLASGLAKLQGGQFQSNYPGLMAGALAASMLMIVLYIIFQKQFVEGIASSGQKL